METLKPRALSNRPREAAVMPLPSELTTPPVKKINFAISGGSYSTRPRSTPRAAARLPARVLFRDADRVAAGVARSPDSKGRLVTAFWIVPHVSDAFTVSRVCNRGARGTNGARRRDVLRAEEERTSRHEGSIVEPDL